MKLQARPLLSAGFIMSYSFMLFTSIKGTKLDLQRNCANESLPFLEIPWPVVHVSKDHRKCKVCSAAEEQEEVPGGLAILSTPAITVRS